MFKKKVLFRVRVSYQLEPIELTVKEIVKHLKEQHLVGDELFSEPPYLEWKPLSAHPKFYDVLVKRIFKDEYKGTSHSTENLTGLSRKLPFIKSSETLGEKEHKKRQTKAGDNQEKTKQAIVPLGPQDLESLFDPEPIEKDPRRVKSSMELSLSRPAREAHPIFEKTLRIESEAVVSTELPPMRPENRVDVEVARKKSSKPRLLLIGLLGTAAYLFLQTSPSKKQERPKSAAKARSFSQEKIKLVEMEATHWMSNHMPLFYQGAFELLYQAEQDSDLSPKLMAQLAESFVMSKDVLTNEDEKQIEQWIAIGRQKDPYLSDFYRVKSWMHLKRQNLEKAQIELSLALETDPYGIENKILKGYLELQENNLQGAQQTLSSLSSQKNKPVSLMHLTQRVLWATQQYESLRELSVYLLKMNPVHCPSYVYLGLLNKLQSDRSKTQQFLDVAASLAPFCFKEENRLTFDALADLTPNGTETVEFRRIAQFYESPFVGFNSPLWTSRLITRENLFAKAEIEMNRQNSRHAFLYLQAAYLLNTQDGKALLRLAQMAEKMIESFDDILFVKLFYEQTIEKSPELVEAYLGLGALELEQFNFRRALELFLKAEKVEPQDARVYLNLGKYYYKTRDFQLAQQYLEKSYLLDSIQAETIYYAGLVRLAYKQGATKDAMENFFKAFALDSTNYDALIQWIKLKVKNYEKTFAIRFIKTLQISEPKNPYLYWALGEAYAENKEFRRSIDYYHKALDLNRSLSKVRFSLGAALEAFGELPSAAEEYKLSSDLNRKNGEGYFKSAEIWFRLRDYGRAEALLLELSKRWPYYPGALKYLAKIYRAEGKTEKSIELLRKEIENNPLNPGFRLDLAEILMVDQQYEEAIKVLTELNSSQQFVNNPEYTLDKIRAYLFLSRCERALGRFENAEGSIRLALGIDENDPELIKELGYVYLEQQRDKEAIPLLENALTRNPADKDADKLRGLLQKLKNE